MATATLLKGWTDGTNAYVEVAVVEAGGQTIHYSASVPLDATWQAANVVQKRALLVAAVKAVRDAQQAANVDLGLSGTATI